MHEKIQIAFNLISMGTLSNEAIAAATQLTLNEGNKLAAEISSAMHDRQSQIQNTFRTTMRHEAVVGDRERGSPRSNMPSIGLQSRSRAFLIP